MQAVLGKDAPAIMEGFGSFGVIKDYPDAFKQGLGEGVASGVGSIRDNIRDLTYFPLGFVNKNSRLKIEINGYDGEKSFDRLANAFSSAQGYARAVRANPNRIIGDVTTVLAREADSLREQSPPSAALRQKPKLDGGAIQSGGSRLILP